MSTRGDLYLRSNRTIWDRPFGQHFTIQHDAFTDSFLRIFKKAYSLHKKEGYPLETCITLEHPRMLEANADKYGGFYANIDLVDNRAELGCKEYGNTEIFFRGCVDELLAMEEWMLDSKLCFRVRGRRYTDSTFQFDVIGRDSAYTEGVSFFEYLKDNTSLSEFKKFLTSGQKCFTISLREKENAYMAFEKIPKEEFKACLECNTLFTHDNQHICDKCGWSETNELTCNTCAADVDLCECE